jgi:hypothetical protein
MAEKYHIAPNGLIKKCTANKRKCPYGDAGDHFSSPEEAQVFLGYAMQKATGLNKEYGMSWKKASELGWKMAKVDILKCANNILETAQGDPENTVLARKIIAENIEKLEERIYPNTIIPQQNKRFLDTNFYDKIKN